MALSWKLMYRLGITPWESVGEPGQQQIDRLLAREGAGDPPFGKALDIGCGRGAHTLRLARLGWQPTGIDFVPLAIKKARERATAEGVQTTFVVGDVTRMAAAVGTGYRFLLDVGCFHLLNDDQQVGYAREVDAVADPDGILLLFAFQQGTRPPLPAGLPQDRIESVLAGWKLSDVEPAVMPRRLEKVLAQWYRFQRR